MPGPERILVTGSSGFFGSWICRALEAAGHEVIRRSHRELDLTDATAVARTVAETGPGVVVNAAAVSSPALAREDPSRCFAVNTGGTLNLLEALRARSTRTRLVTLSSAAVYRAGGDDPLDETDPPAPHSIYGASKLAAETLCGQYSREVGLRSTILRTFNLVGPGQPTDQAAAEFAAAAGAALDAGRDEVRITVGDPETRRDFTDVRDAADAVRAVIESGADGLYNLCSGRTLSLWELGEAVAAAATASVGRAFTVRLEPDPGRAAPGSPRTVCGSRRRLTEATGWAPHTPITQSLSDRLAQTRRPQPQAPPHGS